MPIQSGRVNFYHEESSHGENYDYYYQQDQSYFALKLHFNKDKLSPGEETTAILFSRSNAMPKSFKGGEKLLVRTMFKYKIIKDSKGDKLTFDHSPFFINPKKSTNAIFTVPAKKTLVKVKNGENLKLLSGF